MNDWLKGLLGAAMALLLLISIYQIFLKPPDSIPSSSIVNIDTYYGEDVLAFINQKSSTTTK